MLEAIGTALKQSLSNIIRAADHTSGFKFAVIRNLGFDAVDTINHVLDNKDRRRVAFWHHCVYSNVLSQIRGVTLPRIVNRRATYVSAQHYLDCMVGAAQVVFDAYAVAEYERRANGSEIRCKVRYRTAENEYKGIRAEYARVKLATAFDAPMFVGGEVTGGNGITLERREGNFDEWARRARDHPFAVLEHATNIKNARLMAAAIGSMKKRQEAGKCIGA